MAAARVSDLRVPARPHCDFGGGRANSVPPAMGVEVPRPEGRLRRKGSGVSRAHLHSVLRLQPRDCAGYRECRCCWLAPRQKEQRHAVSASPLRAARAVVAVGSVEPGVRAASPHPLGKVAASVSARFVWEQA